MRWWRHEARVLSVHRKHKDVVFPWYCWRASVAGTSGDGLAQSHDRPYLGSRPRPPVCAVSIAVGHALREVRPPWVRITVGVDWRTHGASALGCETNRRSEVLSRQSKNGGGSVGRLRIKVLNRSCTESALSFWDGISAHCDMVLMIATGVICFSWRHGLDRTGFAIMLIGRARVQSLRDCLRDALDPPPCAWRVASRPGRVLSTYKKILIMCSHSRPTSSVGASS